MKHLKLAGIMLAVGVLTLTVANAQKKKGPGVLNPDWKAEGGSYSAPMGKLGEKPSEPWSSTTVAAAIQGRKTNPAKVATVTGEILDFSCYLQIGKHGEKHRSCAQKCFTAGQPVGLLAEDGSMYMLMEEEHDPRRDGLTDFRKAAIEHASHIMEVSGTLSEHGGYKALYVTGYLKK
ncbi:MAG: hypothetical protein SFV51_10925 [Bryobacteraceae bacterium]|nr:hypothetical protein [Bryobacteraceae bacterium]